MRALLLLLSIMSSFALMSCRQENATTVVTPAPDLFLDRIKPESAQPFEDTDALINGRSLLIKHMTEVENLSVPLTDTWEPDGTYTDGEWQVYRFNSGAWVLTMAGLREEADPTMFRILFLGPNDFNYAANIFADGTVMPNQ